jgi:hypothetical protein
MTMVIQGLKPQSEDKYKVKNKELKELNQSLVM